MRLMNGGRYGLRMNEGWIIKYVLKLAFFFIRSADKGIAWQFIERFSFRNYAELKKIC